MTSFARRKADCLGRKDKSNIGKWDGRIAGLCRKLNRLENYYTLSSCSGRIVLIKNLEKKTAGMFVFRSHEKVSFDELKKVLLGYKGKEGLIFKQEPPILHVACASLKNAEPLLEKARKSGWKNSGIMSIRMRVVLELRSTEYLALPIMEKGKILADDEFLKVLIRESNLRLERGWRKINKLRKSM